MMKISIVNEEKSQKANQSILNFDSYMMNYDIQKKPCFDKNYRSNYESNKTTSTFIYLHRY